jgi:hypothetical protein
MKSNAHSCAGLVTLMAVLSAPVSAAMLQAQALSNEQLATLRGGVLLPNGLDISIGIDIQTLVNGQLALHTVLSTEAPTPFGLRVLNGGSASSMPPTVTIPAAAQSSPLLVLDRQSGSSSVAPTSASGPNTTIHVLNAPTDTWPRYPDENTVPVSPNGPSVTTPFGTVQITQDSRGAVVSLSDPTLLVQHLVGEASGVTVANTANNQVVQTQSAIDVDVHGAWPAIANALFRVNNVATNAAVTRN